MKHNRQRLGVLRCLALGLSPLRRHQLGLRFRSAWRRGFFSNDQSAWFLMSGVARLFWKPVTLFHLSNVPVQLHSSFLVYPVGVFIWGQCETGSSGGLFRAAAVLLLFCGSLLVHEFSHVFVARFLGIGTRRVLMIPFGFVAQLQSRPRAPIEVWIALAGPLASLGLVGIFWLLLRALSPSLKDWLASYHLLLALRQLLRLGFALNLIVATFNMLPCFPMDGGRALRSILAIIIARLFPRHAGGALLVATRIAVRYVAWPVALGMIVLTVFGTEIWIHLVTFPLLVLCAEAEYWVLRQEVPPQLHH